MLDSKVLNEGSEPVVLKHFVNAFRETNLRALLEQRSITELVVVGSMSHMCIDGVVRAAVPRTCTRWRITLRWWSGSRHRPLGHFSHH